MAAVKAAQLGMKTAVVERENLGGICLNWGCIPTKALLKSAQVFNYISHAANYGVAAQPVEADITAMVQRSRGVAETMSKGVQFLLKKNGVDVIMGTAKVKPGHKVSVTDAEGKETEYEAEHIIIATGARSRVMPSMPQDGKRIIGYREAMTLPFKPKSMVVCGSGAIGSEFAFFYQSIGVQVTLVEFMPQILPNEDEDTASQISRSFRKMGMKVMASASVEKVDVDGDVCHVTIKDMKKNTETVVDCDVVLSAVGVITNLENLGLEETGIEVERTKIVVDDYYRTNVPGYYAIGDVVHGPALAHVAQRRGHLLCGEDSGSRAQAGELQQYSRLHVYHSRGGQRGIDREESCRGRQRGAGGQVLLQGQRKGHSGRQYRWFHQDGDRQEHRRDFGLPHVWRQCHGDDSRYRGCPREPPDSQTGGRSHSSPSHDERGCDGGYRGCLWMCHSRINSI